MKRSILWGALLGVCLAFGGYRIYPVLHPINVASHGELRERAIVSQLEQIGPGSDIFIGDSITELAYMPTLCKKPALNAGIGGYSSAGILEEVKALPADAKFDDAYLAFGTNDVVGPKRLNAEAFERTYSAVISALRGRAHRIFILTIPGLSPVHMTDGYFRLSDIADVNEAIKHVATQNNVALIDVHAALTEPDGTMRAGYSADGVHLSALGYRRWLSTIESFSCPG
jgi:lysophospholipase L1-like esterase